MATSKAGLWTTLQYAVKVVNGLFKNGSIDTNNFLTNYRALQAVYEGNNVNSVEATLAATRSTLNTLMNQQAILTPIILELARVGYNGVSTTAKAALQEIRDGMAAISETVKERGMTFGDLTIGLANVGDGILIRLSTDKNGDKIESGQYQSGNIICTINLDSYTGRQIEGRERAILKGDGTLGVDSLERGTCPTGALNLTAVRNEDGLLVNAQFSYVDNGATITLTDWILDDDEKNVAITVEDDDFREGSNTITFLKNNYIEQEIKNISQSDPTLPYFLIALVQRVTVGDGNAVLRMSLGSKEVTIAEGDMTGLPEYLILGAEDENGWYDNWKESGATVKIGLELSSGCTVKILNMVLAQPVLFDGLYYMLVSGAEPFVSGDVFTATDTSSNTGAIQSTLARLYSEHLPHTSGTPTYADV